MLVLVCTSRSSFGSDKFGSFSKKNEAAGQAKIIYRRMPESSELARQSIFFAQRYGVDPKTIRDIWYLNLTC